MTVVVAGTMRLPPERLAEARPHMRAMIAASRAEPGCLTYAYAEDVTQAGLIRVFEAWSDQAALDAHAASAHLRRWRAAWPKLGLCDRRLIAYEAAGERPL